MARKNRAVLNREALHELDLRVAGGLEAVALEILGKVDAPDATPFGEGLVERGGLISYVDGRRVGGDADKKPDAMRVRGQGVVVGVGYGWPGRWQETGTVNQPPRPFFTPVVLAVANDEGAVLAGMRRAHADRLDKARARMARSRLT